MAGQASGQVPTAGRIVQYTLDASDVARRGAHIGNKISAGDVYPMMITRVWGDKPDAAVNGQVFLDGNDVLYVTSIYVGEGPRTYAWPVKS